MLEIIEETLIDGIKLLPFLFITYLLMELIEHKKPDLFKNILNKSKALGPFIGALLGVIPQCGFSLIASGVIKVDVAEQQKSPLKDAQRAHEILESRATQGSSLLIP